MKKVISILLALLSVMVFAIPTFAAATLNYNDFNTVEQNDGTNNFIDWAKKKNSADLWIYYNDQHNGNAAKENRGIEIGSTQAQVFAAFGKTGISKVDPNQNGPYTIFGNQPGRLANQLDVPVTSVDYTYHKTGRDYHKLFYFDEDNKVCLIVWYIS